MKEIYEYEHGLPEYLQHDLDMYKEGLRINSNLLDCYWGELYGSINGAEIDDLRSRYLWGHWQDEEEN